MKNIFKDKDSIILFIVAVIILVLVFSVSSIYIHNTKSEVSYNSKTKNSTIPQYKIGDKITPNELREYFPEIYESYTLLITGLAINSDDFQYPYISSIEITNNDKLNIFYSTKVGNATISFYSIYNRSSNKLDTLIVDITGTNNELNSAMISHISSCGPIVENMNGNIDSTLSYNLLTSLNSAPEDFWGVYNQYKDVAWVIKVENKEYEGVKCSSFYLTKEGSDSIN